MSKLLSTCAAALVAATALATSVVPASAGGGFSIGFGSGYGAWDPWYGAPHGGIYVGIGPAPVYQNAWEKHVNYCFKHHPTYDPSTNLYQTKYGYNECDSPWF